jgi:hypothetical protein
MTVVVVDKPQFFLAVFAAPLDGLGAVFADRQRARSAASDPGTGTIGRLR